MDGEAYQSVAEENTRAAASGLAAVTGTLIQYKTYKNSDDIDLIIHIHADDAWDVQQKLGRISKHSPKTVVIAVIHSL